MGKLRVTLVIEYEVDPVNYGVTTMEEAAEQERGALENDAIGTIAFLGDLGEDTITVEVVE